MKNINLIIGFLLSSIIFSCNKNDFEDYSELIVGDWTTTNIEINGIDGDEILPNFGNSIFLSITEDTEYYRNYVSGSWVLNKSTLSLLPIEELQIDDWIYEILDLTENTLKLRIELTKGQYGWGFDQFDEDEILSIVETYSK